MAINILNTNYSGEVLEKLLTLASTGNELVERGLIHIEPNVSMKFSIPRLKATNMLQKRKARIAIDGSDSQGDFIYSERELEPKDFMAYTEFNPRTFETIWRKWQPKGALVFAELPPEGQNALLTEMAKVVKFQLGYHFINGEYADTGNYKLFNGFVYRIMNDPDKVAVTPPAQTTMIAKLTALRDRIPKLYRKNPKFRVLMSDSDFDTYDAELTALQFKGVGYDDVSKGKFKDLILEPMSQWPEDLFVGTVTGMDYDTNLWAAVNLVDDYEVIQIDKVTNASEVYFFKMLMKADTQTAFGEELFVLDMREDEVVEG